MTRERGGPVPPDEELYRRLRREDVDGAGSVQLSAIDLEGTSVDRAAFRTAEQARDAATRGETGIAVVTGAALPGPVLLATGIEWEWFAVDWPEHDNEAHAELRARRITNRPGIDAKKPGTAVKAELKAALARVMRVRIMP